MEDIKKIEEILGSHTSDAVASLGRSGAGIFADVCAGNAVVYMSEEGFVHQWAESAMVKGDTHRDTVIGVLTALNFAELDIIDPYDFQEFVVDGRAY